MENYEQFFIIDGYNLSGITQLSSDFTVQEEVVKQNGAMSFDGILNQPIEGVVTLSRNFIYNDPIFSFSGENGYSGALKYNGVSFGFTSAYLSSYSIEGNDSSLPTVNASFNIVGNLGGNINAVESKVHPPIYQPTRGSIKVSLDEVENQVLKNFSVSYEIERSFDYVLGSTEPQVTILPPIIENSVFSIEVDDYSAKKMKDYLDQRTKSNITINFNNFDNLTTFMGLNLSGAKLLSTSFNSTASDTIIVNLTYRRYLA